MSTDNEGSVAARALPAALDMSGRRTLVTEAGRGIGREVARCFAQLGADLVITDIEDMDETAGLLAEIGVQAKTVRGDLADERFLNKLITHGPYYAVASVAAVFLPLERMDTHEGFNWVLGVNLQAPMLLADRCLQQMAEQGGGRIVLVGSAGGRNGGGVVNDSLDYAAHAASKGGLHSVMRWMSRRAVGKGVLVNRVAPGPTATPMHLQAGVQMSAASLPMGRMGTAEEVAWAITFLGTPAAGFISGAVLDVNGGQFVG